MSERSCAAVTHVLSPLILNASARYSDAFFLNGVSSEDSPVVHVRGSGDATSLHDGSFNVPRESESISADSVSQVTHVSS